MSGMATADHAFVLSGEQLEEPLGEQQTTPRTALEFFAGERADRN